MYTVHALMGPVFSAFLAEKVSFNFMHVLYIYILQHNFNTLVDRCLMVATLCPSWAVGPNVATHCLERFPVPAAEDIHGAERETLCGR